jgi:hypothetical protein
VAAKTGRKIAVLAMALVLAGAPQAIAGNEAEKAARQCAKHGNESHQCAKAMEKCMRKGVECGEEGGVS